MTPITGPICKFIKQYKPVKLAHLSQDISIKPTGLYQSYDSYQNRSQLTIGHESQLFRESNRQVRGIPQTSKVISSVIDK